MNGFRWLIGGLLAALCLVAGCNGQEETPAQARVGQEVPIFREFQGQQGPFPDRAFLAIQRPEAWNALWGDQPAPEIDFSRQTVLVALMGQQPTAGYTIDIVDVRATGQNIMAYVATQRPDPDDVVAQVLTYPYSMVVVPKLSQPVSFALVGDATPTVAIQDLFQGQQSQATQPRTVVIRDTESWSQFWAANFGAGAAPPTVDFSQHMAVAVFAGTRATTGYGVRISSVERVGDQLAVNYRLRTPQTNEVVEQTPTSPYAIALVPTTPIAVAFRNVTPVVAAAAP